MSSLGFVHDDQDEAMTVTKSGLDTLITVDDLEGGAIIRLSWVEAQQLYRWLKERLGE